MWGTDELYCLPVFSVLYEHRKIKKCLLIWRASQSLQPTVPGEWSSPGSIYNTGWNSIWKLCLLLQGKGGDTWYLSWFTERKLNLDKHRQGKFESVPLAKLLLYQFSVLQTEIFILVPLEEWPWHLAFTVLHYVILITGCILAFSVTDTTLLTPSLDEAVSVPVPEWCNLETAVVMHRRADLGACVANVQMESGKLITIIKRLKAK